MSNRGKTSIAACGSSAAVRTNKVLRGIVSFLLLVFPTATLFLNRGDSYVLGILTLIGIGVWLREGARRWLDRQSALLWIAFVLFFAVALLSYLVSAQTDAGFRFLGRYLRFLLLVPVYLALRRYPPTVKTIFIGLAAGALFAGVIGGLHYLHADRAIRIEATTGLSIIFGDLVTTMVLCTVAGFGLMTLSKRAWPIFLMVLCLAGGIAATLLSGTRGAWIPLLLLPFALMTPFGGFLKRRYIFAIVLVLVAVFSSLYLIAGSGVHKRIREADLGLLGYFASLQYIDSSTKASSGQPVCINGKEFLRAWLRAGHAAEGAPDVKVLSDPGIGHETGCMTDYGVRLHNGDHGKVAQYVFPRVSESSDNGQHTKLVARGVGTLTFAGGESKSVGSINSQSYQAISLSDPETPGKDINVFIAPGRTVWLVPFDSYFGEYSFSIADNNVGQRLEMWRAAWRLFLEHPGLGVGTGAYQTSTQQLIHSGVIASFVSEYDHPHDDYLNALASSGIVGFLALLGVLLLPAWYFQRAVHSGDKTIHALGLAGLLTVAGFAIYALTDTVFLHSMMITWYVIYMATFYALIKARADKQKTGAY